MGHGFIIQLSDFSLYSYRKAIIASLIENRSPYSVLPADNTIIIPLITVPGVAEDFFSC